MYALSPEEMDRIINYLNGYDDDILNTDIPKRLFHIAYDVNKKMQDDLAKQMKLTTALSKKVDRLVEKKNEEFAAGNFAEHEAGFHDTDIALFAIYYLRKAKVRYRTETVIGLVYLVYAIFLTQGVRLTVEHPEATDKGPWFWRIYSRYKKGGLYEEPAKEDLRVLFSKDNTVAAIMRNVVNKYHDVDIMEMLKNSKPWKNNDKNHNDGKWNKRIPDTEIWNWQKTRI